MQTGLQWKSGKEQCKYKSKAVTSELAYHSTIMDKINWHKLKLVQKVKISIQTESLEFGSAIRLTRKFEILRIAWVRGS